MGALLTTLAAKLVASITASIGGFLLKLFGGAVEALRARHQDTDRVTTHERAGVAEAAQETGEVIADIADERSALTPGSDDPDELARRLRGRKSIAAGGGGGGAGGSGAATGGA